MDKSKNTLAHEHRLQDKKEVTPSEHPRHERMVNMIIGGSKVSEVMHSTARRSTKQAASLSQHIQPFCLDNQLLNYRINKTSKPLS